MGDNKVMEKLSWEIGMYGFSYEWKTSLKDCLTDQCQEEKLLITHQSLTPSYSTGINWMRTYCTYIKFATGIK